MTFSNFFVLSGGPGGGKTSLLNALQNQGYPFIPETARAIIKERLALGLSPRPEPAPFARAIFQKDQENFITNTHLSTPIFFDRSFLDSAVMLKDADPAFFTTILPFLTANRYNNKVFLTPPWAAIYRTDDERDQTFEEAVHYTPVLIPPGPIEQRVDFIRSRIG